MMDNIREPIFLRKSNCMKQHIEELKKIRETLTQEGKEVIDKDVKCLEYGMLGEANIEFELKNSHMPMYVIHDLYVEDEGLSAQIDYLVITNKYTFLLECKNLYGNIDINNGSEFVRTVTYGRKKVKEGIYSPITQSERHLKLLKRITYKNKKNMLTRFLVDKFFESNYKTLVVLANPKTIIDTKYAKKEVKEQIIRADQLVKYIKDTCNNSKQEPLSNKQMLDWAEKFIKLHIDKKNKYLEKYNKYLLENNNEQPQTDNNKKQTEKYNNSDHENVIINSPIYKVEDSEIYKELKAYRQKKSREENIKAYYIYNNNQLEELIEKMPKNLEELNDVKGFAEVKISKYGKDIIEIVSRYV